MSIHSLHFTKLIETKSAQGETLIILKALGKEHIDEVIKISREMNSRGATESMLLIGVSTSPSLLNATQTARHI